MKARDLTDVKTTFWQLEHELIRHVFFHAPFDEASLAQAKALGPAELRARVRPYLAKKIGPEKIFRDTYADRGVIAEATANRINARLARG